MFSIIFWEDTISLDRRCSSVRYERTRMPKNGSPATNSKLKLKDSNCPFARAMHERIRADANVVDKVCPCAAFDQKREE